MQWIQFSVIECSVFYAEWCNVSRLNEVDTMQLGVIDTDGMQWIPCSVAQWIPIECSGFQEACLNAVDSMQSGAMYLD